MSVEVINAANKSFVCLLIYLGELLDVHKEKIAQYKIGNE